MTRQAASTKSDGGRFVGRSGIRRRLCRLIDRLAQQNPSLSLVLLMGEEGMGKGRLLQELEVHAASLRVRTRSAYPSQAPFAWYRPVTDLLGPYGSSLARDPVPGMMPPRLDARLRGELKSRALARLRAAAAAGPLTLFIHDVDRADRFTFELLEYLPLHLGKAPALIVASLSRRLDGFPYQRLRTSGFCREIVLPPWTTNDIADYLSGIDCLSRHAAQLARRFKRATSGRPSLVLQACRLLEEEGIMKLKGEEAAKKLREFKVPANMAEVVVRRLPLRSPDEQIVLTALAALCRPTSLAEVEVVTRLPRASAVQALAELVGHGLAMRSRGRAFEIRTKELGRAVVALAAQNELRQMSSRIARRLATLSDPDPVELAYHFAEAGRAKPAAEWALRAKDRLIEQMAFEKGRFLVEHCIALAPEAELMAGLLFAASELCYCMSALVRAQGYLSRARGIWHRLGRKDEEARCLLWEARIHKHRSEYVMASTAASKALVLSESCRDVALRGQALAELGGIEYGRGAFDEAVRLFRDAIAILETSGDRRWLLESLLTLGSIHFYRGDYEAAEEMQLRALDLAEALGSPSGRKRARENLASLMSIRGESDRAMAEYKAVLALERDLQDTFGQGITHYNIGVLMQHQGRYGRAMKEYSTAKSIMERVGNRRGLVSVFNNMASIKMNVGDLDGAMGFVKQASRIAVEIGDTRSETGVLLALGSHHESQSHWDQAVEYLEAALAKAIGMRERRQELQARFGLTRVATNRGDDRAAKLHTAALVSFARKGEEPEFMVKAHLAEGLRHLAVQEVLSARGHFMSAVGISRQAFLRELEVEAHAYQVETLRRAGEEEAYKRELQKVRKTIRQIGRRIGSADLRARYLGSSPRREMLAGEPVDPLSV